MILSVPISETWLLAARCEGRRRDLAHVGHGSYLADEERKAGHNVTGLVGEIAFMLVSGCPVDWSDRPGGDGGADFTVGNATIDAKTATYPKYLFLPVEARNRSDLYVQAGWREDMMRVDLLGWETRPVLERAPTLTTRFGVTNHAIPAGDLRPMWLLFSEIERHRVEFMSEPCPTLRSAVA